MLSKLKKQMPNLHSASVSDKEFHQSKSPRQSQEELDCDEQKQRIISFIDSSENIDELLNNTNDATVKAIINSDSELIAKLNRKIAHLKPSTLQSINFENYKFRCSQLGKLTKGLKPKLTDNQKKELIRLSDKMKDDKITDKQIINLGELIDKRDSKIKLSEGAKTYLNQLHKEFTFGRRNDITSKYLAKGIQVEEKALTLYTDVTGKLFVKNQKRYSNDWIVGTPDNTQGMVRDIKSSFELSTFPMHKSDTPTKDYVWQVNGYMELTGFKEAELIYCLVDTPHKIINDDIRRLDWKEDILTIEGNVKEKCIPLIVELVQQHIYTNDGLFEFCSQSESVKLEWFDSFIEIPKDFRVKIFRYQYDPQMTESLREQISVSREYLNDLTISMMNNVDMINRATLK